MDDLSNWEFAAAVAGVCIGLGGLLLFTLIVTVGSWRLFDQATRTSKESEKASVAVQDLARQMAAEPRTVATTGVGDATVIAETRVQTSMLVEQQARLQDALRTIAEAQATRDAAVPATAAPDPAILNELRAQTSMLIEQQARLQEALSTIASARALSAASASELETHELRRISEELDQHLQRVSNAMDRLPPIAPQTRE